MKICYGSTRTVVLTKNYAFKFPSFAEWRLFLLGLLANMQEAKFSTMNHPLLCPVKYRICGGFLVVMPRCEPMNRGQFDSWVKNPMRLEAPLPVEDKLDSWGWLRGQIVAVDYGN